MNKRLKLVVGIVAGASVVTPPVVMADDVPDALSVEWQGKKPCEKLFEHAPVRMARCTLLPGPMPLSKEAMRNVLAHLFAPSGTRRVRCAARRPPTHLQVWAPLIARRPDRIARR